MQSRAPIIITIIVMITIITQLCAVWHQRGDVLQGGDGEGWHGTSPGAIMIITIIIIKVGTGPHQERIKMRKGREVERMD